MRFLKLKMWLASISKKTWIYVGCISGFVVLAITCLFIWMHLCGYTLASWLAKFWPTVVVLLAVVIAIALIVVFFKMKKRR